MGAPLPSFPTIGDRAVGVIGYSLPKMVARAFAFKLASDLSIALRIGGPSGDTFEEVEASDRRIRGEIVDFIASAFTKENLRRTVFKPFTPPPRTERQLRFAGTAPRPIQQAADAFAARFAQVRKGLPLPRR